MLGIQAVKVNVIKMNFKVTGQKYHHYVTTYVPGFSPKYFTIWDRNTDTKHTTGEQITGN
jgi:hypothetical protein